MNKGTLGIVIAGVVVIVAVLALRGRNNGQTTVSPSATEQAIVTSTPEPSGASPSADAGSDSQAKVGTDIGNLAPDFELTDYSGKKVKLSSFRGKSPVFLNFWASWCPFCVGELPLMAKVQQQFAGKYVTLAVNRGESQSTGQSFTNKVGVAGKFTFLNDPSDSIYAKYNSFAMPYSLFMDKSGIIHDVKLGPLQDAELKDKLNKIIQ